MEFKKKLLIAGRIARTFLPFLFYLLLSLLIRVAVRMGTTVSYFAQSGGSTFHLVLAEFLLSALLLHSFSRLWTLGDPFLSENFSESEEFAVRGQSPLRLLLHDRISWIELCVILGISFLLPLTHGIYALGRHLFSGVNSYFLQRLLILLISFPFLSLAYASGRLTAFKHWQTLAPWDRKPPRLLLQLLRYLGVVALYLIIAYMTPAVLSVWGGFAVFVVSIPVLFLAFLLLLFAKFLFNFMRVLKARRHLLHKLHAVCKENGYLLQGPKRLYRSILFPVAEPTLTVTVREGEVYDCLVYSCLRHWSNLFFDADGTVTATAARRPGLFALFPRVYSVITPYAFESENRKLLIVTPSVRSWYLREGSAMEVHPGARAWGYKIYNTEVFVGLLDRDALGEDYRR